MSFLMEDSSPEKVPKLLEDLLITVSANESVDLIQEDIFFILIIILMVENGLIPVLKNGVEWDQIKPIDKDQIDHWKSTGAYEVFFFMSGFNDIPLKLILCPLGATMSVNLLINYDKTDVYTTFLAMNRYILSTKASAIPMIFNDLKHLSYTYKDKIIAPAKSRILNFYGFPSASLLGLPAELFFYVILHLPLIDILNMAKTCKRLMSMIETDNFWHKLFIRDFEIPNEKEEISWKSLYKKKYNEEQEKKIKSCRLTGTLHAVPQYSLYGAHIDNPHLWALLFD